MKAVLDTSGWYAAISQVDEMHGEAAAFINAEHELLILETVFEEIIALLHSRRGKKFATVHGRALIEVGLTPLVLPDLQLAWNLYKTTSAKVSYVDCTIVVTAKKYQLPVFGFDQHFIGSGVTLVP